MSGHTPEPWTVNGAGGDFTPVARLYPHGVLISAPQPLRDEIDTARRIVACVNALEGVEDPGGALFLARMMLRAVAVHLAADYSNVRRSVRDQDAVLLLAGVEDALDKLGGAR